MVSDRVSSQTSSSIGLAVAKRVGLCLLAGLLLASAFLVDDAVARWLAKPIRSGQTKAFVQGMRCWGEGATIVVLVAAFAFAQPARWRQWVHVLIVTFLCAGSVDLIKPLTARERPSQKLDLPGAEAAGWNHSFPSGHVATAFAFARGVSTMFPATRPVCIFAGCGTALSRMHDQRHFLSDCLAGAALGWFVAGWILSGFAELERRRLAREQGESGEILKMESRRLSA